MKKRKYIKPDINKVILDYSISLLMLSAPTPPAPRSVSKSQPSQSAPFASPFDDKTFN